MSTIIATNEGCINGADNLPEVINWKTDEPTGFQFFAAFDYALPGECRETVRYPTTGFHREYTDEFGQYTVELDLDALRNLDCGIIVQFDAHKYSANGLVSIADGGLKSLLYNTSLHNECKPTTGNMGTGYYASSTYYVGGVDSNGTEVTTNVGISQHSITPVPEPASGWILGVVLLLAFVRRRR